MLIVLLFSFFFKFWLLAVELNGSQYQFTMCGYELDISFINNFYNSSQTHVQCLNFLERERQTERRERNEREKKKERKEQRLLKQFTAESLTLISNCKRVASENGDKHEGFFAVSTY